MAPLANYYAILEVNPEADIETISKAISEKRRFWQPKTSHPKLETRQTAEKLMRDISDAETVLNDPPQRGEYDRKLAAQVDLPNPPSTETPGAGRDWLQIALEYLSQGNAAQANYAAREATGQLPENPEAWYFRGVSSALVDHDQDALFELNEAIRLDSNQAAYHAELGDLYKKNSDWRDALGAYQRASNLEPNNAYYKAGVGLSYGALGEVDRGAELLRVAHEQLPDDELVRYYYALALLEQSTSTWSKFHDGTQNILSEAQLNHTKEKLAKIDRLNITDREFQNDLDEVRVFAEQAESVKFQSFSGLPGLAAGEIATLIAMTIAFNSGGGGAFLGVIFLGLLVLWPVLFVRSHRVAGWQWNRKQAPAYARNTGLQ
ncbi:DnaJ domain-containing protein [Arthrobacter sp. AB6]|uniref:J domain-containing protein n=1 Tax=Arthrobacter sp. AB6 TaxID=2962570 RepID=UPI0028815CA6|nr:DnaJ domain-containing protein [Arthrobacter sp. AB6]MDT0197334.1 DnaJ domain-containing protein [Arthrobacter sp. AB6]